ncbi:prolyl oligopeptidase family serine peptidase [Microvirga sp. STR05]|uniref:Prolyl oligopeptidase family serine peptidase n=1 Tax=Hymenobacter duratus TaxID=2771356 RepID=A0ABR8JP03_9BACT|nr:prolyl oligopeptidase family serine peptidase [Hymenobacter duratus]MBD2717122.1 prolyl oligopeptidase family serine peptidase [Hymenobacter duratus]MBR7952038.1 prolyl oligopeptidase family serine peptidase [Microvirga sp. STR05]
MKWIRRLLLVVLVLVVGFGAVMVRSALRTERPVGFQLARTTDPDGKPLAVGIWYPTQARTWPTTWLGLGLMEVAADAPVAGRSLPLVVISHGNSGGPGSHADLALALANAGYIVAAPMHSGDNYADQSAAGTVGWLGGRTRQLHATLDYLLTSWPGHAYINPERIGAFGFSAGGLTVLTAVGAQPDLRLIAKQCTDSSPEAICKLLRAGNSPLLNPDEAAKGNRYQPDARIKAAVVAAPGLGFTMGPGALTAVRVPVQLWSGDQDTVVSYATNIKQVRDALGAGAEFHSVPGAGHFSFLAPCGPLAPPLLCTDQGQFDREAFHRSMNASVIAFFEKAIR